MKLTKIRFKGMKPRQKQLQHLIREIQLQMKRLGFEVFGEILNSTSIKLSSNKCQFRVIPEIIGHNTRYSPHSLSKRTRIPSWDQRVDFNNKLNEILNRENVTAKAMSGPFIIRDGSEAYTERDWHRQTPDYIRHNQSLGYYIETGYDAEEAKAERIEHKRREAILTARAQMKAISGGAK